MWNCFETEILLRTCKHKFEKWKFQQSGTFFVWVHIFYFLWNIPLSWNHWEINFMLFGLNVSLLDKKITHVWKKSHMFGIYHSTRRPWCGWVKPHMFGKNHCQFVFSWSGKNHTCVAFIKHVPNTKVCGKSHTCL